MLENSTYALSLGIGIPASTGYAGTQHRVTYTCVGDTVNLAARIEDYTKAVNRPILIDANIRASLPDSIPVDSLGKITLKGKNLPVQIYPVRMDL